MISERDDKPAWFHRFQLLLYSRLQLTKGAGPYSIPFHANDNTTKYVVERGVLEARREYAKELLDNSELVRMFASQKLDRERPDFDRARALFSADVHQSLDSGMPIPNLNGLDEAMQKQVWRCLCDLQDFRTTGTATEKTASQQRLQESLGKLLAQVRRVRNIAEQQVREPADSAEDTEAFVAADELA